MSFYVCHAAAQSIRDCVNKMECKCKLSDCRSCHPSSCFINDARMGCFGCNKCQSGEFLLALETLEKVEAEHSKLMKAVQELEKPGVLMLTSLSEENAIIDAFKKVSLSLDQLLTKQGGKLQNLCNHRFYYCVRKKRKAAAIAAASDSQGDGGDDDAALTAGDDDLGNLDPESFLMRCSACRLEKSTSVDSSR